MEVGVLYRGGLPREESFVNFETKTGIEIT